MYLTQEFKKKSEKLAALFLKKNFIFDFFQFLGHLYILMLLKHRLIFVAGRHVFKIESNIS